MDRDNFVDRFVSMDETWVDHFKPESTQQSKQWTYVGSPLQKKAKAVYSAGKVMTSIFLDAEGTLMVNYLQQG